jgi:hypothetical protein
MVHWYNNNDKCILTMIENKLRNRKDATFTYSYISPICNITKKDYDKFVWYLTIKSLYNIF